nr:unnamed protein product [Callosobruchus chinensis]
MYILPNLRTNQKAECITKISRLIQYFCSGNSFYPSSLFCLSLN